VKKYFLVKCSKLSVKNKILWRRSKLITIQKTVRMHLARKQHRPRYLGLKQLAKLQRQTAQMEDTARKLKREQNVSLEQVKALQTEISDGSRKIKVALMLPWRLC
jgi:myosin-6